MLVFDTFPKVTINLTNGLYIFSPISATGKTYLANTLQLLADAGEPVLAYTYSDYKKGLDLLHLVRSCNFKILIVDRLDMCKTCENVLNAINEASHSSIVLVDVKSPFVQLGEYRTVDIYLRPDHLEVSL